jgi:DnaJ-class molecular chaperone
LGYTFVNTCTKCPTCKGSGTVPNDDGTRSSCTRCGGSGVVTKQDRKTCSTCLGTGGREVSSNSCY